MKYGKIKGKISEYANDFLKIYSSKYWIAPYPYESAEQSLARICNGICNCIVNCHSYEHALHAADLLLNNDRKSDETLNKYIKMGNGDALYLSSFLALYYAALFEISMKRKNAMEINGISLEKANAMFKPDDIPLYALVYKYFIAELVK